jgi:tripartite-type tricarboxylate transporter receptor subunit TctC
MKYDDFPHKRPVTLTVPHGKGGCTDIAVRILTQNAESFLGVPVHILNLGGINGSFALDLMVDSIKALPDGYSLSTANSSIILSPLAGQTKYRYIDEIWPLLMYAEEPFIFAVAANKPWRSISEFILDAKKQPYQIRVGNSGTGNVSDVVMRLFCRQAGITLATVSFDSGKALCDGLDAGKVDCMITNRVDGRYLIETGRIHILASAAGKRPSSPIGSFPTFHEESFDIEAYLRQGIGISRNVPQNIKILLEDDFHRMAFQTTVRHNIEDAGMTFSYMNSIDYEFIWHEEEQRWKKVLGGLGV